MGMIGRRNFLKKLGATPLAAKVAADEALRRSVGLNDLSTYIPATPIPGGLPDETIREVRISQLSKTLNYIKAFGIPEFHQHELRKQANRVYGLDVDIASKKTWSMAVKVNEQKQRNYQRMVDDLTKSADRYTAQSMFKKLLGFDWPWANYF